MGGFFVAGLALATGQVPFGFLWLALAGLCVAFWLFDGIKKPFSCGWLFGFGYFFLSLFWIKDPFYVMPEIHGWMAPFALFLMPAFLALYWAVAFKVATLLRAGAWGMVFCLSGMEILRGLLPFGGFAWNPIAAIWLDYALDQSISVWGVHGLGLLTLLCIAGGVAFARERRPKYLICLAVFVSLMAIPAKVKAPLPERGKIETPVRIIQPNIAQNRALATPSLIVESALSYSGQKPAQNMPPPAAIIWPEGALGHTYREALPLIHQASGAPLFFSGVTRLADEALYNAITIARDGREIAHYDKYRLVPFGEYIPAAQYLKWLKWRPIAQILNADYAKGTGAHTLDIPDMGKVLPLICFEAAFPLGIQARHNRADWILNVSNDAWFGNWSGPLQHLAQVRLRAIELGLPILRAANTGVSAIIDARGRIVQRIELNQAGVIDGFIPPAYPPTFYAQVGEMPVRLIILIALGWLLWRRWNFSD